MLKQYRNSSLSRKIGSLKVENVYRAILIRTGNVVQTALIEGGLLLVAVKNKAGKLVRGYGQTLVDALRSLAYSVFCGDLSCE